MLILYISNIQGGDLDRFDVKYQDFPDATVRVDAAWIQGGCRDMQDTLHIFNLLLITCCLYMKLKSSLY